MIKIINIILFIGKTFGIMVLINNRQSDNRALRDMPGEGFVMVGKKLYSDRFVEITESGDAFYLESFQKGMSTDRFNEIIKTLPMLRITSVLLVNSVLTRAPHPAVLFAERKERIIPEITSDGLKAYITLNLSPSEFEPQNRKALLEEILGVLAAQQIVYGIRMDVLKTRLMPLEKILIAEGVPAVNGEDAQIRQYSLENPKPQVIDNDRVNHYELNLIHHINQGGWLGERKDPTPGFPGKTVTGKTIAPIPGKMLPLLYDRVSVREEYKDGVTTLYARKSGAVLYKGDRVTVYDYMEIKGDVDFRVGNVDFDGFLTVKGTVEDNFAVTADRDIEIMGEYGVGAAQKIESRNGNIYIKGGIAGKSRASIRCTRNLYVKFLKDVEVVCDGTVYIGFYSMNANIRAKQVIIESNRGRIIGGTIHADIFVAAAEIGNRAESRTIIKLNGFDRGTLKAQLDYIVERLERAREQITKIKQLLHIYSSAQTLTPEQRTVYIRVMDNYAQLKDLIRDLELERRDYVKYLKTPGEGAVTIHSRVYPKVRIEIKSAAAELAVEGLGGTWFYSGNELHAN